MKLLDIRQNTIGIYYRIPYRNAVPAYAQNEDFWNSMISSILKSLTQRELAAIAL